MKHIVAVLLFCGVMMFDNFLKAKEFPVTAAHQAFALESEWLNVSHALTPEDLKGRVILVDFWTFCCINCIHIVPDLQYLEQKFGDKLTVIGVHSAKFQNEKDTENIRNAVLRYGIHHPVANDKNFKIWQKFGVRAWPTLVLINPEGRIETVYSGEGHRAEMEEDISGLLKKYDGRINTAQLPIRLEITPKSRPAFLRFPGKLEFAADRNLLFIADSGHHRIVAATPEGQVRFMIGSGREGNKDGSFAEAEFHSPQGMAYREGMLYVADTENHVLKLVNLEKNTVQTIAGTGKQGYERRVEDASALSTPMASPWDVAFYPDEAHLAIAMAGTHQLWSYDIAAKTISVLAGNGRESIDDGAYPQNSLSQPSGLAVLGDQLFFVDSETSSLRVLENGEITTLIGSGLFDFGFKDGKQGEALLQHALGLAVEPGGKGILIADSYNHAIRRYDLALKTLTTLYGDGKRGALNEPNDVLAIDKTLYIADTNNNGIAVLHKEKTTPEALSIEVKNAVQKAAASDLPNLRMQEKATVQAAGFSVAVVLPKGWKINAEAPSYLALFEAGDGTDRLAETLWDTKALQTVKPLEVTARKPGEYLLQGTLYYCKDAPNAPCLIQSISQKLLLSAKKASTSITVELKP